MTTDVYVDLLFLINFSMDYLCLYICVKILHQKIKLSRMLLASTVGGAYSVAVLFIVLSPVVEFAIDCAVCLILCTIAFAQKGRRITTILMYSFLYVGISMMTGGCMTAIFNLMSRIDLPLDSIPDDGISTYLFAILAAVAGIISLKSGQIISRRSSVKTCRLHIKFCNKEFEFFGLCDSGNLVRDPISHKPVIFVDRKKLEEKLDLSFLDEYAKGNLLPDSPCKNLRLIVINTATGSSVAVAAVTEELTVFPEGSNSKHNEPLILDALISPVDLAKNNDGYNAVIPAELIK